METTLKGNHIKTVFYDDYCKNLFIKYKYLDMIEPRIEQFKKNRALCFTDQKTNVKSKLYCDRDYYDVLDSMLNYITEYQQNNKEVNIITDNENFDFNVSGTSFRQDTIRFIVDYIPNINDYISETYISKFSKLEEDYMLNTKIYKYEDVPIFHIDFETEPENPHDCNAVKVLLGTNEYSLEHVGYVPRDINKRFAEVIMSNGSLEVECYINGGDYKIVFDDENIKTGHDDYFISMKIKYKPE